LLVADSGPLIALARLDLLALPHRLFGETLVSVTVWQEVLRAPKPGEDTALAAALQAGWLRVVDDPPLTPPELAGAGLDDGERSAIALALTLQAAVLVDERRGRTSAKAWGLHVLGTLGLLVRARDAGLVQHVRPLAEALLEGGYYLARPLIERALATIGE
jgi:predicted nucleic acid-binding protein